MNSRRAVYLWFLILSLILQQVTATDNENLEVLLPIPGKTKDGQKFEPHFELHGLKYRLSKVVVKVKLVEVKFHDILCFFLYCTALLVVLFMTTLFSFVGIFDGLQGISTVERAIILNEAKKESQTKQFKLLVEG